MIHLIEDETNMRELLDVHLGEPAHQVVEAHNMQQALSYLDEGEPDLMILNLRLPDLSAFEILDHMDQTLPEYVNFPVVLVSTIPINNNLIMEQYPRVVRIFTNPFDRNELLEFIQKTLNRQ